MNSHGKVTFYWDSNILYVEAFGPFNEEGVIKTTAEYLNVIANRSVADFSIIEIWDEESLASPEAMNNVGQLWEQLISKGCISIALVISNSVQQGVAELLLPSIGKVFHKKEDAEYWITNGQLSAP